MRKVFLFLMIFTFTFSYSQDWKFLLNSSEGIYYYSHNSDQTSWVKLVSDKTIYYSKIDCPSSRTVDGYTIILYKFDCQSKKLGVIESTVYSKDGVKLDTYKVSDELIELNYVEPNSKSESFLLELCKTK